MHKKSKTYVTHSINGQLFITFPSASPAQRSTEKKESFPNSKKTPRQQKAKSKGVEPVPFNRLMDGVVFVLSGFQNPFRGELREKALEMGAKYRPDWTPDSTHLM